MGDRTGREGKNEPRGDLYLPKVGHALAFIATLDCPEGFGVNPEVAHERMAGLNFMHGVAQAAEALKAWTFDVDGIAAQGLGYERLDQLTSEVLLGAR